MAFDGLGVSDEVAIMAFFFCEKQIPAMDSDFLFFLSFFLSFFSISFFLFSLSFPSFFLFRSIFAFACWSFQTQDQVELSWKYKRVDLARYPSMN